MTDNRYSKKYNAFIDGLYIIELCDTDDEKEFFEIVEIYGKEPGFTAYINDKKLENPLDKSGLSCYTKVSKRKEKYKMTYEEKYHEKYADFCKDKISRKEWADFCTFFLEELMEENADILKKLKEDW